MTDQNFDRILTIGMKVTLYTTVELAIIGAFTIINTVGTWIWS